MQRQPQLAGMVQVHTHKEAVGAALSPSGQVSSSHDRCQPTQRCQLRATGCVHAGAAKVHLSLAAFRASVSAAGATLQDTCGMAGGQLPALQTFV